MNVDTWLAFVFTASIILIIPGPTLIYVMAQSLMHGNKASLPLASGVILGDSVCIVGSLIGLSALLAISATLFSLLKFVGAAYLIYLGYSLLRQNHQLQDQPHTQINYAPRKLFNNVFTITALNPKGIVFFSAFMPQFVNTDVAVLPQFLLLGITFIGLAFINVMAYSLMAGRLSQSLQSPRFSRWFNYAGGTALIGAGVVTASAEPA